jgi:hypothetical protein
MLCIYVKKENLPPPASERGEEGGGKERKERERAIARERKRESEREREERQSRLAPCPVV